MVILRPQGFFRFIPAAFLGLWLCGWAAGEGVALWLLGNGLVCLMSGMPIGSGSARLGSGPTLAVGGFLILWLAVWTIAGIAAMTEFFRLVWGEDRIQAEGGGLSVAHLRGPFRSRREFPRDTLRRFVVTGRGALTIETTGGTVELSRLGTGEEREAAASALRAELGLSDPDPTSMPVALPKGWEEIITPEGERAVVPDRATRRVQARVAGAVTLVIAAAAAAAVLASLSQARFVAFAIQLVLGAIVLTCATLWLVRGRMEWRIGNGAVTLRRRFGPGVRDIFEARAFELNLAQDRSDSAEWFALDALSNASGASATVPPSPEAATKRKRVTSVARDPIVPRQLGAYLARAGNVTLVDRTTPEARAAELTLLKARLERSGSLGRFAVRLVVNAKGRKQA